MLLERDRLIGEAHHIDRRIVDLMEVAEPDLIVTDAIEVALGGGRVSGHGHLLGAVILATNAVAHDATCARILGLHPENVGWLRLAYERGYGPIFADEIELLGERKVGQLLAKVRSMAEPCLVPVVDFPDRFRREARAEFPLEIVAEPPWDFGASHGALLEWLHRTYDFKERRKAMAAWAPATVICGDFVDAPPPPAHDRVFLVGDHAIRAWRRLGWRARGWSLPKRWHAFFRGPTRIERFSRPDGRRGWAIQIAGDPPAPEDLDLGFALGSWLKMRSPLLRPSLLAKYYAGAVANALARAWRNLGGIEVACAAEIRRLAERKAARAASPAPRVQRINTPA